MEFDGRRRDIVTALDKLNTWGKERTMRRRGCDIFRCVGQ